MEPLTILLILVALGLGYGGGTMLAGQKHRLGLQELRSASEADVERRLKELQTEAAGKAADEVRAERERIERDAEEARERIEADEKRVGEGEARVAKRSKELERRAQQAERREADLARRESRLGEREQELSERAEELAGLEGEARKLLEDVGGLSAEEARRRLVERVEEEARAEANRAAARVEDEVRERAEVTAKNIISMAIQRYAGEYTCERTVSVVHIPSDDLKGKIIGREGRNIRALEAATGVDFIIDDTPETIIISAFNPIRRQVARIALEALIEDGRIHPTRIDQLVRRAETEFNKTIRAAGREAAEEVGVTGVHPELLRLVGALKYRTSYGQNQWQHALEVSFLSGNMAAELGLDIKKARRCGLLHDIGKVMDQTAEGSHALIGAEFARKHGEKKDIVNAIAAHHEEVPQQTVYAWLAQAADAISGARPGARREASRSYSQRLQDLERISNSFPGVDRSYAVQAGREVRVLVSNGRITDDESVSLSREIARKIESEMTYPGQIRVTVIRETRIIQYAR